MILSFTSQVCHFLSPFSLARLPSHTSRHRHQLCSHYWSRFCRSLPVSVTFCHSFPWPGFPLTQVGTGTSFAVTSGHDLAQDWSVFRGIPTLVVLMAGRNLSQIASKLLDQDWCPETPVSTILDEPLVLVKHVLFRLPLFFFCSCAGMQRQGGCAHCVEWLATFSIQKCVAVPYHTLLYSIFRKQLC